VAATLDDVRDWVGSTPDDDTVTAALDRADGDAQVAALGILRRRLVDMLANPTSWADQGDYQESWAANIAPLKERIADLERRLDTASLPALSTGQLERCDSTRFPRFGR